MKIVFLSISLMLFNLMFSQSLSATEDVMRPINALFNGMREHNSEKILSQFTPEALLQRAQTDGTIKQANLTEFAHSVSTSKAYLDEQLFAIKIHQQGNLAIVWAPFVFYADEKLSHCGVNSFQLIKSNQDWKIQYLIDTTYQGNCEEFQLNLTSSTP